MEQNTKTKTSFEILIPTPSKKQRWDVYGTYDSVAAMQEAWNDLSEAEEATHVVDFVTSVDGAEVARLQVVPKLALNPQRQ